MESAHEVDLEANLGMTRQLLKEELAQKFQAQPPERSPMLSQPIPPVLTLRRNYRRCRQILMHH